MNPILRPIFSRTDARMCYQNVLFPTEFSFPFGDFAFLNTNLFINSAERDIIRQSDSISAQRLSDLSTLRCQVGSFGSNVKNGRLKKMNIDPRFRTGRLFKVHNTFVWLNIECQI